MPIYEPTRPWVDTKSLESDAFERAYQSLTKHQKDVLETMRQLFIADAEIRGLGNRGWLELLMKVFFKDELDKMERLALNK